MMQRELAEHIGCSRSNLIRWASANKISLDAHSYKPEVKAAVLSFYEMHGRRATEKAFPDVSVRSIVERNYGAFAPRQLRWTDKQIIEAARMAGLVSFKAQARYFNRPNANEGSIKSLWMKRFGHGSSNINGMPHWYARSLVWGPKVRYVKVVGTTRKGELKPFMRILLWVDIQKHMRPDTPKFIKSAVRAMANFQRWLHDDKNPRAKILKMINERELTT